MQLWFAGSKKGRSTRVLGPANLQRVSPRTLLLGETPLHPGQPLPQCLHLLARLFALGRYLVAQAFQLGSELLPKLANLPGNRRLHGDGKLLFFHGGGPVCGNENPESSSHDHCPEIEARENCPVGYSFPPV